MKNQLTRQDFDDLNRGLFNLDGIGALSERPYAVIDLAKHDMGYPAQLTGFPCPIIGIGDGPLAAHCDVVCAGEPFEIYKSIEAAPMAATVLVQQLRTSERLPTDIALTSESMAYASVQCGAEFSRWLEQADAVLHKRAYTPLSIQRGDHALTITLNNPDADNAIDGITRDALCEILDMAIADPDIELIKFSANGRIFSTGGAVAEFGSVSDPATAHSIRNVRLPATRLAKLSGRLEAHIQGPAIGAGIEMAAFAARVTASPKAWFQLPELKYGLIPGAGGTVSIPRRIGRQKTAYMALSMKRIRAKTALNWGLIDAIID